MAGEDFTFSPMPRAVFGPCIPCTEDQLMESIPITIVDDVDLELYHSFNIAILSIDPAGVGMIDSPLAFTITDNGQSLLKDGFFCLFCFSFAFFFQ